MQRIKQFLAICVVACGLGSAALTPVGAVDICAADSGSVYCQNQQDGEAKVNSTIQEAVKLLLMVAGIISVIIIIVGGILFTVSIGDSSKTAKARNAVIYAVVGLVVAAFSYALVEFVFNKISQ